MAEVDQPVVADRDTSRESLIERIERAEAIVSGSLVRHRAMSLFTVDLTMQQLRVLFILAAGKEGVFADFCDPAGGRPSANGSRERGTALSAHELADALGVGPTTLTGIVDRLEARNLVCRLADGKDRRVRRIDLTDAGRRLVNEIMAAHREHRRELLSQLEPDVLAGLAVALEALAGVCERAPRNAVS
ncbi:MAG TPA: MarR family transcriptional regulator [Actinopolymorphaceae bacterium]